jgi:hypothetical protein
MRVVWPFALALAALVVALIVYRSCTAGTALHVEPHAGREIEKAKQR